MECKLSLFTEPEELYKSQRINPFLESSSTGDVALGEKLSGPIGPIAGHHIWNIGANEMWGIGVNERIPIYTSIEWLLELGS